MAIPDKFGLGSSDAGLFLQPAKSDNVASLEYTM